MLLEVRHLVFHALADSGGLILRPVAVSGVNLGEVHCSQPNVLVRPGLPVGGSLELHVDFGSPLEYFEPVFFDDLFPPVIGVPSA